MELLYHNGTGFETLCQQVFMRDLSHLKEHSISSVLYRIKRVSY